MEGSLAQLDLALEPIDLGSFGEEGSDGGHISAHYAAQVGRSARAQCLPHLLSLTRDDAVCDGEAVPVPWFLLQTHAASQLLKRAGQRFMLLLVSE